MKKLNALDVSIIITAVTVAVLFGVLFAHSNIGSASPAQITLNMTENTDSAKYVKIGDSVWIGDSLLGSVSSVKSLDGGGIAITINASVTKKDGFTRVGTIDIKLGKSYTFRTKRILGSAVCDSISGERQ